MTQIPLNSVRYNFLLVLAFFLFAQLDAQQITVDDSQTPQQLIENNLVQGCVQVSNITSTVNGSVNGFSSFGYFEQGSSNFPFANGIVLSSGNVNSAGNGTNTNPLNEGDTNWVTDPDLEAALGITNTLNATSIQFDFISTSDVIQFNYILASEEYFNSYPCDYSDGFAFLIKEAGTANPYQNIAVIPGTNTPVNTNTIHEEIVGFCPAENDQFFEGYNLGDTNFNGRTTVLSTSASITPNIQYSIKLIIADQTDINFDTAVFIEGNSFTDSVSLGSDISTCNASTILNANTNNPLATYAWYVNDILLSLETASTLNATLNGTYTVEVTVPLNTTTCTFQDEINVTLNSVQTGTTISNLTVCDDISNDGSEFFDLTVKDSEVLASLPASNYTISYHLIEQDAIDNINAITSINNTTNPQTIYIRAEDTNSGCVYISSILLIVDEYPIITDPDPIEICSNGTSEVFLTDYNDSIINGNTNLNVNYYFSQTDAEANINDIPSPYIPTASSEQLFIRVESASGCIAYTSIMINTFDSPNINTGTQQINACEQDGDGFDVFDLTSIIDDVLQGTTNVTVTFHLTQDEAINDINPITNTTNFPNTVQDLQTIYIRIENDSNTCFEIVALELHTNILETGTNIINFNECDTAPDDGSAAFDLNNITDVIANNLLDITVTYFETQNDLDNNTNAVDATMPYIVTNSSQTLYILIENTNCSSTNEIVLTVNPSVTILNTAPVTYCDTNDDGLTTIDLSTFNDVVNVGINNAAVSYFANDADAQLNTNELPQLYNNTVNPTTLYVRVLNSITGCFDVKPLDIEVLPAPTTTAPSGFMICDDDQDGFSIIDLTSKIPEIISSTSGIDITFFLNQTDADANTNEIINTTNYNAETATVYAKVSFQSTGCYNLVPISILVNTLPEFPVISNYSNCETDGNQIADFIFSTKDAEILNGQTGKDVLYFENEINAINRDLAFEIDKNAVYNNTSQTQTIFVRVENTTDTSCFDVSSFLIEIGSVPVYNLPNENLTTICDDISNDGFDVFSLNAIRNDLILNSSETNLTVTFYLTENDLLNQTSPIDGDFTNTVNPQTIYADIGNNTFCNSIVAFPLSVIQVPIVNSSTGLRLCDADTDGMVTFDLTIAELEVLAIRQNNLIITYYANENDLNTGTNAITNPANYTNVENPQTVYIALTNPDSMPICTVSVPIELIVDLPPTINPINTFETCVNDANTFDLNETIPDLIGTQQNVSTTFYSNLLDAQMTQNGLDTNYIYTSNSDTVYVRAEFTDTNCFNIGSFNIQVNSLPQIASLPNLEACDDDFDNLLFFDLSQQSALILGSQNPANFTVSYFESETDAINNVNLISDLNYQVDTTQIFYIRIENNTTGCFETGSFSATVHRKPFVEITDQVICLDNLPLTVTAETEEPTDTYLWSTGETSSEIEIVQTGNYSVTVTSAFGCTMSSNFSVTVSEAATIEFTETVDFSDPNNITVTVNGIGDYLYQFNDEEPQESNVFLNVPIGPHVITVIDLNGCNSTTKDVVIIDAPQFVTPNGDGYFDTWHITGVNQLPGTIVNIYDRYGKLLITLKHNSYGWDGTYNGNLMPANDYWYSANVVKGSINFEVKGHFALKR